MSDKFKEAENLTPDEALEVLKAFALTTVSFGGENEKYLTEQMHGAVGIIRTALQAADERENAIYQIYLKMANSEEDPWLRSELRNAAPYVKKALREYERA